jgi:hypothetical protein
MAYEVYLYAHLYTLLEITQSHTRLFCRVDATPDTRMYTTKSDSSIPPLISRGKALASHGTAPQVSYLATTRNFDNIPVSPPCSETTDTPHGKRVFSPMSRCQVPISRSYLARKSVKSAQLCKTRPHPRGRRDLATTCMILNCQFSWCIQSVSYPIEVPAYLLSASS